jgi:hypothetical protein
MSIFILTNKNLKGRWRTLLVTLYAVHLVLLIGCFYLNNIKMISGNRFSFLFGVWLGVAVIIMIAEFLFHRSIKGKIKS